MVSVIEGLRRQQTILEEQDEKYQKEEEDAREKYNSKKISREEYEHHQLSLLKVRISLQFNEAYINILDKLSSLANKDEKELTDTVSCAKEVFDSALLAAAFTFGEILQDPHHKELLSEQISRDIEMHQKQNPRTKEEEDVLEIEKQLLEKLKKQQAPIKTKSEEYEETMFLFKQLKYSEFKVLTSKIEKETVKSMERSEIITMIFDFFTFGYYSQSIKKEQEKVKASIKDSTNAIGQNMMESRAIQKFKKNLKTIQKGREHLSEKEESSFSSIERDAKKAKDPEQYKKLVIKFSDTLSEMANSVKKAKDVSPKSKSL